MRAVVAAYVSGHGFGHFTRSAAVLERLAAAGCDVRVRTGALTLPLARAASWATSAEEAETGPMVAPRGPFESDVPATLAALKRHLANLDRVVEQEAAWIKAAGASLVFADHPPLALAAAAAARVPSVSMGNFTWSWILAGFGGEFVPPAETLARLEAMATLHLMLPFSAGMDHLPRREPIPLVVRPPTRARGEARKLLPLPAGESRQVVLVSFGGFTGGPALAEAAARNPGYFFVAFSERREQAENLATLPQYHALPHQDLVLAADALLCKPGYGTVAEAIAARRSVVYAPREGFRETEVLVPQMQRELACAPISRGDLVEGRWAHAIDRALLAPWPAPQRSLDGAQAAANRILSLLTPSRPIG